MAITEELFVLHSMTIRNHHDRMMTQASLCIDLGRGKSYGSFFGGRFGGRFVRQLVCSGVQIVPGQAEEIRSTTTTILQCIRWRLASRYP